MERTSGVLEGPFTGHFGLNLQWISLQFLMRHVMNNVEEADDAEILTSEVHDPYARTTGA